MRHATTADGEFGSAQADGWWSPDRQHHLRAEALRALQSQGKPLVYAIRCADGVIKIGCSTQLVIRRRKFGGGDLLAFRFGDTDDEQVIHDALVTHRHHGREWYNPTPEVLAVINAMRADLGLDALVA